MSSAEKKINSPVNDDENEKSNIQSLIEKELDLEESILNEELSDITSGEVAVGEQSKKVDKAIEKNVEDVLLNDMADKPTEFGDSDNQDDDLLLRWDDDLEEEATLSEIPKDKSSAKSCNVDLTFQENVIETINEEEKVLDILDEDSVPSSVLSTPFVPKTAHGLNKPDMMLEIPTQGFFECSDDEGDQMTNLEMSPDEVLDVNKDDSKDIDEDILLGTNEENSNGNLMHSNSKEINDDITISVHDTLLQQQILTEETIIKKTLIEPDSEAETKLAADIISKELNESKNLIDQDKSLLLGDNYTDAVESEHSETKQIKEHTILQASTEIATLDDELKQDNDNEELLDKSVDCDDSIISLPESEIDKIKTDATQAAGIADAAPEISIETMECDVENINKTEESIFSISSNTQINPKSIEEESKDQNITDEINMDVEEQSEEMSKENNSIHDQKPEVQEISKEKQEQDEAVKESLKDKLNANLGHQLTDATDSIIELQNTVMEISEPQPSTSYAVEKSNTTNDSKNIDQDVELKIPQSRTSFSIDNENSMFGSSMAQNDVSEMADSLGLLAESSRVVEDDEEHEYDEDGDGDDDDDFDNYEDDSNFQVTAENSEDSNAQHSEIDIKLEAADKDNFDFTISDVTSDSYDKKPYESNETVVEEKKQINEADVKEETLIECKFEEDSKDAETEQSSDIYGMNVDGKTESILMNLLINNDDLTKASSSIDRESPDDTTNQVNVVNIVDLEESSSDDEKVSDRVPTEGISKTTDETEVKIEDTTTDNKNVKIETKKSPKKSNTELEQVKNEIESVNENENKKSQMSSEVYNLDSDEEEPVVEKKELDSIEMRKSRAEYMRDYRRKKCEEKLKSTNILKKNACNSTQRSRDFRARAKSILSQTSMADPSTALPSLVASNATLQLPFFSENNVNVASCQEVEKDIEKLSIDTPKCINKSCSQTSRNFYVANFQAINFYEADKKKRLYVCQPCADALEERNQELIAGIKNFTPLLELGFKKCREDLVEISDSDSEEETEFDDRERQVIGESGAKIIEQQLAAMINETWEKFKMDARLAESNNALKAEMSRVQKESEELNDLLKECEAATDKLRNDLYLTFEPKIVELPTLIVFDTPNCSYSCTNASKRADEKLNKDTASMRLKRGRSPSKEIPSKRPAIPLGYTPLEDKANLESIEQTGDKLDDDSTDVAVVKLCAESAPKDLPPSGEMVFAPLKVGMTVYAMKNTSGSWLKARIVEIIPKSAANAFTACRVKFEHRVSKQPFKTLPARHLAYYEPPDVRMTIGRRVIALFKDVNKRESFYSGIVAEIPNPVNSYRYLIFFDDGYAQYAAHAHTRLVCESAAMVWDEVQSASRDFVRKYLLAYPERPMVRLHAGQNLKTEWRGKWLPSRVLRVDASLVEVQFLKVARREWIYRGSTRLAPLYLELKAAERHRPRAMPRTQPQSRSNMPYVEYTRSDEQNKTSDSQQQTMVQQQNEELRRQRAVAKKSTSAPVPNSTYTNPNLDNVCSRVVYYTPKNAVKPFKMVPHTCSPKCKRKDVLALKDLRTYNPLAKPLLSGWERQIVRWKCHKDVIYRAPCGRRLRDMRELHKYLRDIQSDMAVDLFDFSPTTHCLAEFVLNKCFVGKKDLSHGKENVPVPCVNYYDDSLPEFCSYNTERTPTAGVPLNLDPEFLCGCDCEDDCEDKTKCACWKMTLEGAKTIGLEGHNVGYVYKRLPEPLPSGIYECNSRCKCKHTCLNRVAQHPLQLKLQVFKTANRGWGIRALNDIPKGAFLCVYAGNLLTDATANLDGLNEGDEYLAELDYIEVVEQMKEGYEEDIPDKIKKLDKKESSPQPSDEAEEELSSEGESNNSNYDQEDDDFQPGYIYNNPVSEFNKRLRRRDSKKDSQKEKEKEKELDKKEKEEKETNPDEECITISDDEEVREPSCFTAAAGMGANEFVSKYRSVRTLFGEDEACYIMDAKVQGNIGRYLNHSCSPNVFVQNVFVDTHDPRFPWVAFFALSYIKSGTELTWNYNYDVGSVPGKIMYCKCGALNCRGRLL